MRGAIYADAKIQLKVDGVEVVLGVVLMLEWPNTPGFKTVDGG